MSLEAFQTQSYVTRALTLWAQQKQQQGVRVTQKMIRQEAATLAARHERSMRSSGDSTSSADSLGMGRSVSPQCTSSLVPPQDAPTHPAFRLLSLSQHEHLGDIGVQLFEFGGRVVGGVESGLVLE